MISWPIFTKECFAGPSEYQADVLRSSYLAPYLFPSFLCKIITIIYQNVLTLLDSRNFHDVLALVFHDVLALVFVAFISVSPKEWA